MSTARESGEPLITGSSVSCAFRFAHFEPRWCDTFTRWLTLLAVGRPGVVFRVRKTRPLMLCYVRWRARALRPKSVPCRARMSLAWLNVLSLTNDANLARLLPSFRPLFHASQFAVPTRCSNSFAHSSHSAATKKQSLTESGSLLSRRASWLIMRLLLWIRVMATLRQQSAIARDTG